MFVSGKVCQAAGSKTFGLTHNAGFGVESSGET